MGVLALMAFTAPADAAKCTKRGTNGDDVVRGTKKADVLCGRGGNDILLGRQGKDRLLGGDGEDTLDGGAGNDLLDGQEGADSATFAAATTGVTVNLANGSATGQGTDKTAGVENVVGSAHNDILTGGGRGRHCSWAAKGTTRWRVAPAGTPSTAAPGIDKANYFSATWLDRRRPGGRHCDGTGIRCAVRRRERHRLVPGRLARRRRGRQHAARRRRRRHRDLRRGRLRGHRRPPAATPPPARAATPLPAIENVVGSPQPDTIAGDAARNSIDGGAGSDTVSYAAALSGVSVDLVNGTVAGGDTDALTAVENAIGTAFADALIGGDGVNQLTGGDGNDTLAAGAGEDVLLGQVGDDQIYGEPANDVLSGGDGDDMLDGGTGTDSCDGGAGTNQFAGGCDTSAPQLEELTIFPASVDTSGGPRNITFTLELTDAVTGIDGDASRSRSRRPTARPEAPLRWSWFRAPSTTGRSRRTVTVPQYAPEGTWTASLLLSDNAGNEEAWSSQELVGAGFPVSFDQTGPGDEDSPELTAFSLTPGSIDTSAAAQDVTFSLGVTDNLAGLDLARLPCRDLLARRPAAR